MIPESMVQVFMGFFSFLFFFWRAVVSCVCACTIHFGADMDGLR